MDALIQLMPLVIILAVFYLLVWKPQLDEQARHKALVESLSRDDEVILDSGLHGKVVKVSDDALELEVAKGVKVTVERNKVARRKGEPAPAKSA